MNFAIQSNEFEFQRGKKKRQRLGNQNGIELEVRKAEQGLKIWEENDLSPRIIYPAKLWIKDY